MYSRNKLCFFLDSSTTVKICFSFIGIESHKLYLVTITNRVINNERKRKQFLQEVQILKKFLIPALLELKYETHIHSLASLYYLIQKSLRILNRNFRLTERFGRL
jgi:hypothetical protein